MAAHIKNRRRRPFQLLRQIQVRRDIKPRQCLEVQFLDGELLFLQLSRDDRFQIRPLWHGPKPEHLLQLPPILAAPRLPILQRTDVREALPGNHARLPAKVIRQPLVIP